MKLESKRRKLSVEQFSKAHEPRLATMKKSIGADDPEVLRQMRQE